MVNQAVTLPFILTIDKVDPETPIEHQPVRIFCKLTNRSGAPVSGNVSSPLGGGRVTITDLADRDSITFPLVANAPAAGSSVTIQVDFFKDPPDPPVGEFVQPSTSGFASIDVGGRYSISIDQFEIITTRALHNDTDYVGLQIRVDDQVQFDTANPMNDPNQPEQPPKPQPVHWRRMGDVNDGVHVIDDPDPGRLVVGPFDVLPKTQVWINYQIQNVGFNLGGLEEFLNKVSAAAAGVLGIIFPGSDWTKAHELTVFINDKQFANCDGVVAMDFVNMDGKQMNDLTSVSGSHSITTTHPGTKISPEEFALYRSADGCGATSEYKVTYTIQRVSFQ